MSSTIQQKTIDSLNQFKQNLKSIQMQSSQFQFVILHKLAKEIVLDKIHEKMRSAKFSQKIIDGTVIDRIEVQSNTKARIFFRSEYFSSTGFDVALAREEGTDKHKVVAGKGKTLPIPTSGGIIFRKSANVGGIPALFIIRNTIRETKDMLQERYQSELINWYNDNLGMVNS